MARWLRWTAAAAAAGSVAAAVAITLASRRWQSATAGLVGRMTGASTASNAPVSFDLLDTLPAPVRRYFRAVLRDGQPLVRTARISQTGRFRTEASGDPAAGWRPFEARQVFTAEPPGFVWDARVRMAPLASVRVRDGYVRGAATMRGAVLGLLPVVDEPDGADLRAGALQRYLAEAVWLPTALLPGPRLSWSPIDDAHARATLVDGSTTVSLDFEFGAGGEIAGSDTPARRRAETGKGRYVTQPWGGRYRAYVDRGGMRVPLESEVYWVVGGREEPYYRGRNVEVEYRFGDDGP